MEVSLIVLAFLGMALHELKKQLDKRNSDPNWKFSIIKWLKNRWIQNLMSIISAGVLVYIGPSVFSLEGIASPELFAVVSGYGGHSILMAILDNTPKLKK